MQTRRREFHLAMLLGTAVAVMAGVAALAPPATVADMPYGLKEGKPYEGTTLMRS